MSRWDFEGPAPAPSPGGGGGGAGAGGYNNYRPTASIGSGRPFPDDAPSVVRAGTSFRPSIAVIIGVLTTMFSLTFLLLLYAKHCKRSAETTDGEASPPDGNAAPVAAFHVDAGLDRAIVEVLPMFTFASLQGVKVCLSVVQFY